MPARELIAFVSDELRSAGYISARRVADLASALMSVKENWIRGRCDSIPDSDRGTYGTLVAASLLFDYVHTRAAMSGTGTYSFQGMEVFATNEYLRRKAGPGDVEADDGTGGVAVPEHLRGWDEVPHDDGSASPSSYIRQVRLRKNRGPGRPLWHTPHDGAWLGEGPLQGEFEYRFLEALPQFGGLTPEAVLALVSEANQARAEGRLREFLAGISGPAGDLVLDKFGEWLARNGKKLADPKEIGKVRVSVASRQAAQMIIEAEEKGETVTLQEAADKFGISRQAVHKAKEKLSTEKSHCDKEVDMPDHIAGNRNSQADFRKLSPEGRERVRGGESLNKVAIDEGVRRVVPPLDKVMLLLPKLTDEELRAVIDAAMVRLGVADER